MISDVPVFVVSKVYVLMITKVRVSVVPKVHGLMVAKVHAAVLITTRHPQNVAKVTMHHFDRVAALVTITYVFNTFTNLLAIPYVIDAVSVDRVTWAVDMVLELL